MLIIELTENIDQICDKLPPVFLVFSGGLILAKLAFLLRRQGNAKEIELLHVLIGGRGSTRLGLANKIDIVLWGSGSLAIESGLDLEPIVEALAEPIHVIVVKVELVHDVLSFSVIFKQLALRSLGLLLALGRCGRRELVRGGSGLSLVVGGLDADLALRFLCFVVGGRGNTSLLLEHFLCLSRGSIGLCFESCPLHLLIFHFRGQRRVRRQILVDTLVRLVDLAGDLPLVLLKFLFVTSRQQGLQPLLDVFILQFCGKRELVWGSGQLASRF
jgi:hypothetical protein